MRPFLVTETENLDFVLFFIALLGCEPSFKMCFFCFFWCFCKILLVIGTWRVGRTFGHVFRHARGQSWFCIVFYSTFEPWAPRGQSWFCIVFYGTFEPWAPVDKVMVSFSSACATMLLCGHAFAALTPHPELRIGWLPEAIFFNELMGISIWGPRYGGSIFRCFFQRAYGD